MSSLRHVRSDFGNAAQNYTMPAVANVIADPSPP